MAVRKAGQKVQPQTSTATADAVEQKLFAFAEQLGTLVGNVQAKPEGWLDGEALTKEIGRIRDGAAELLEQVTAKAASARKAAAKATKTKAKAPVKSKAPVRQAANPVAAPGKRHRPAPTRDATINKRVADPRVKEVSLPALKTGRRGGRG